LDANECAPTCIKRNKGAPKVKKKANIDAMPMEFLRKKKKRGGRYLKGGHAVSLKR